jgi:hypothetical protein
MNAIAPSAWAPAAMLQSPFFAPLAPWLARLPQERFPTLDDCNALLAQQDPPLCVHNGLPLRFVAQATGKLSFEAQYEPRCYLKGEVQTRAGNWHDLFNALVWLAFPQSKAAINTRHYLAMTSGADAGGSSQRGRARDLLTLLDESGVIVPCADPELAQMLRDFRWKDLFWRERARLHTGMDFYIYGHGLHEKALRPYIGMTGQGLILTVEHGFFGWPLARRLAHLDSMLAEYLLQRALGPRELTPVPLLGVPGWSAESARENFYEDSGYFRPRRLSS